MTCADAGIVPVIRIRLGDAPYRPAQDIDCRGADQRPDIFIKQAQALKSGIRPLVELAGKILHRKDPVSAFPGKLFLIEPVHRRLGEHRVPRAKINLLRKVFNVVTDQNAHSFKSLQSEVAAQFMRKIMCLPGKSLLLLSENASDTAHLVSSLPESQPAIAVPTYSATSVTAGL